MNRQPFFIVSIVFILGIFFREYVPISIWQSIGLLSIALIPFICSFYPSYFLVKIRPYLLCISFFVLGIFLHTLNVQPKEIPHFQNKETITFKLDKKLNSNEKNKRYEVITFKNQQEIKMVLSIPKGLEELDFKHYYHAEAYINKAEPPKNDYQFDYSKYLRRKNIYFQTYLPNGFYKAERHELSLSEKIKQTRWNVLKNIDQSNISSKSREFLKGIILADRTEMDNETVSDFTKTGLVHILAISGSHIAIIFGIFFWIFNLIFTSKNRKIAIISSLISIWLFAIFINYGNPVVRSCIMISIFFTYSLLERKTDLLHAIALSALLILVWDTHQIFDVGFQLSFSAVLGIYWLNQPILNHFPIPRNNLQKFFYNIISITLSAQLATLPLVLFYFHQFSLMSFVANFVIIPIAEILIIFSLILTGIIGFGISISFLNQIYDFFVLWVLKLIHWFASFESVFAKNIPFSMLELVLLSVVIYLIRFLIKKINYQTFIRFSFSLLLFFTIRLGLNIYYKNQSETIVHQHYKDHYFSIKDGHHTIFWIKEHSDFTKIEKYIINPYLISKRAKTYDIKYLADDVVSVKYNGENYNLISENQ